MGALANIHTMFSKTLDRRAIVTVAAFLPRVATSAGFCLEVTYFHCSTVVCFSIFVNLFETKTRKRLFVFIIRKTAVESDQCTEFQR